jgi:hypothetical protein
MFGQLAPGGNAREQARVSVSGTVGVLNFSAVPYQRVTLGSGCWIGSGGAGMVTEHLLSAIERLRTTDEPIAEQIETQRPIDGSCDADTFALSDCVGRLALRT